MSDTPRHESVPERAEMMDRYIALNDSSSTIMQQSSPFTPTSSESPEMSSSEPSSNASSPTLEPQLSPPAYAFPRKSFSRTPSNNFAPIPEESSIEEFELRATTDHDNLADVKTALTDLLNTESVKNGDGKMRLLIQTRLMDAEMELKRQRRRRSSAPRVVLTPTEEKHTA